MSEFKQIRVQGLFQPHNGDPVSMFDIDPASLKITQASEYLDPDTGNVVARQRSEMTFENGKTVIHDVLDDGTRVRWTDAEDRWIDRYVAAAHSVIPDGTHISDSDDRRMASSANDDLLEYGVEANAEAFGMRCGIDIMNPPDWDRED